MTVGTSFKSCNFTTLIHRLGRVGLSLNVQNITSCNRMWSVSYNEISPSALSAEIFLVTYVLHSGADILGLPIYS